MLEMLLAYPRAVANAARKSMRRIGLQAVGGALLVVGLGMLTAAAWTVLADVWSPLTAWLVLGAVFVGGALIVFGIASSMERPRFPKPTAVSDGRPHTPNLEVPPQAARSALLAAFLFGFTTYMKTLNRRPD
jgi:hypothetical protein